MNLDECFATQRRKEKGTAEEAQKCFCRKAILTSQVLSAVKGLFADNSTCKGTVVTFSSRYILYAVTLLAKLNCFPEQNELSQQKDVWGEYGRVSTKMFPT